MQSGEMGGQPLSRVAPDADLDLAARVMDTEPEIASLAMRVIASWSYVEYWMTRLLAVFLKTDYGVAHAMMTGIVSSEARWGALDAAATYALDGADRILYDRAIHATAGPRKIRRKYAHHLWTISRTVPDALILVDPQYMVGYHAANLERNAQLNRWVADMKLHTSGHKTSRPLKTGVVVNAPVEFDRSNFFVYRKSDIERDLESVRQVDRWMCQLLVLLSGQERGGGSLRSTLENELPPPPRRQKRSKRSDP